MIAPDQDTPLQDFDAISSRSERPAAVEPLVLSIAEAAQALGVSDDLVYELTERGELPCLRLGRRKVIPSRAIELVIDAALRDFDPSVAHAAVATRDESRCRTLADLDHAQLGAVGTPSRGSSSVN